MMTSSATLNSGSRSTVDAALSGIDHTPGRAQAVLEGLATLARHEAALRLRLAMVLAWVKRQDPSVLGYTSFTAFCREYVGLGDSWTRALVRLVESPLDLVKAAACRGIVPLRVAVNAPGNVSVRDQAEWLLDPSFSVRPPTALVRFEGDDMVMIHRARQIARLCIGRSSSVREVDEFILRCFKERIPAAVILAQARERPERPALGELDWGWCQGRAPAQALLGPWVEPTSMVDAASQIQAIDALRHGREAMLARTWAVADHYALWQLAGFDCKWDFALQVLGWSRRTAQRQRRIGWALEWYPELDQAVAQGLNVGSVALLAGVVGPLTVGRWITVAKRIGQLELIEAVREARFDDRILERYERALADVDRWATGEPPQGDERHASNAPERPAPNAGGLPSDDDGATQGSAGRAPTAGGPARAGPIRVSLPRAPEPAPLEGRGPPGLAEAARWFVKHVRIAPQRGFARIKERDRFRCQNPECGRTSLRAEAHHIRPRSEGGSDDPQNGVTVCRACHLRGIHTADLRIQVERAVLPSGAPALVWRYAGGRVVVALR